MRSCAMVGLGFWWTSCCSRICRERISDARCIMYISSSIYHCYFLQTISIVESSIQKNRGCMTYIYSSGHLGVVAHATIQEDVHLITSEIYYISRQNHHHVCSLNIPLIAQCGCWSQPGSSNTLLSFQTWD